MVYINCEMVFEWITGNICTVKILNTFDIKYVGYSEISKRCNKIVRNFMSIRLKLFIIKKKKKRSIFNWWCKTAILAYGKVISFLHTELV